MNFFHIGYEVKVIKKSNYVIIGYGHIGVSVDFTINSIKEHDLVCKKEISSILEFYDDTVKESNIHIISINLLNWKQEANMEKLSCRKIQRRSGDKYAEQHVNQLANIVHKLIDKVNELVEENNKLKEKINDRR